MATSDLGAGFGVEVEKLASAPRVVDEHPAQRGRRGEGPGDLHSAHFHTQVPRVQDHADAFGLERVLQALGHLLDEPFLILQPARVVVDDARDLRSGR